MPEYGWSREELFGCVTGVCVAVRLNRKCAALTATTPFLLTGSGLVCSIQQLSLAMGMFVLAHTLSVYLCHAL